MVSRNGDCECSVFGDGDLLERKRTGKECCLLVMVGKLSVSPKLFFPFRAIISKTILPCVFLFDLND